MIDDDNNNQSFIMKNNNTNRKVSENQQNLITRKLTQVKEAQRQYNSAATPGTTVIRALFSTEAT